MPAHPFNPGPLTWNPAAHAAGSFRPVGSLTPHGSGTRSNPADWSTKKTIAARLIFGVNVGDTPTYTVNDLIALVRRVRTKQAGDPSSSFVSQRGIYQHKDGKHVVTEDGVQVFIVNLGATERAFQAQMVALAEIIAAELQQETVILEIQVNGISKVTMGVVAKRPRR